MNPSNNLNAPRTNLNVSQSLADGVHLSGGRVNLAQSGQTVDAGVEGLRDSLSDL